MAYNAPNYTANGSIRETALLLIPLHKLGRKQMSPIAIGKELVRVITKPTDGSTQTAATSERQVQPSCKASPGLSVLQRRKAGERACISGELQTCHSAQPFETHRLW